MVFKLKKTQTEDDALHAQRLHLIGSLVSFISHDFNNILTIILGYCDLALSGNGAHDTTHCIKQIQEGAKRAARLTRSLLTLSRQGGKPEILNPYLLFQGLAPVIDQLLHAQVAIKLELAHDLWYIRADMVWLEQAILNLVLNAMQASKKGTLITIRAYNQMIKNPRKFCEGYLPAPDIAEATLGEYLVIEVEDQGCGIPQELLTKIFHPFFTTKSPGSNTGIGLASVTTIIEKSEGHIYVKSQLEKGTTFRLLLPRMRQQEMSEVLQDPTNSVTTKAGNKSIGKGQFVLLVEDEDSLRAVAKVGLVDHGYKIEDFATAEEALVYLDQSYNTGKIPDIVVTDINLANLDGYQLYTEARKKYPNLKVLLISGMPVNLNTPKEWNTPLTEELPYIIKPFTISQLVSRIREILDHA